MDEKTFLGKYTLEDAIREVINCRIFDILAFKAAETEGKLVLTDLEHALIEKLFDLYECKKCGKMVGQNTVGHFCKKHKWVRNPNWRD